METMQKQSTASSRDKQSAGMKSYHVQYGGGLASLTVKEHAIPQPGRKEVLVRIHANSLSYRDLMILRGNYPLPVKPDVVPVSDGAGEVVAIGEDVTRTKPGDRVMVQMFPHWIDGPFALEHAAQIGGSLDGLLTEYALVSEDAIVHMPAHLSYEEAATLPCAALTAWNALTGGKALQTGQTVLTLGSGGVSLFAIQFAKMMGARVIATTSSEEKAQRLKAMGADEVINYRITPDWHRAVRELTNGYGVDQIVEVTGGTLEQSIQSIAIEGQINFVGRLEAGAQTININMLFQSCASVRVVAVGSCAQFITMNKAIEANQLRPVIDKVFSFEEAATAFEYLQEGKYFGKIVISH
ncbi:zinc-dependent alcohol dehydrogenase family protein [Chitinophaga ginsengisoli]|uniref:NADPH:quinone reductase-like Zn-dependent oxidoreductase n=1 Tax=Chitinophaga ginsengisoli TaxID=363837 RepID=A0A2P8G4T5_9BACT|nr:NAD(P)-dependent alcohol dehydrogenase [Chitinophaga ginsengisoli]PSL28991.1 NADPH:quinone reductase-like Zn-dependent oxidoreductase [Chitinophaga ginsengisoli]